MKRILLAALGVLLLFGCSRHFVVEPALMAGRTDADWTVREEPQSRATFSGRRRISLPRGSFCHPGVMVSENAVVLYLDPGAADGLRPGDHVVSIAGRQVDGGVEFRRLLQRQPPGRELEVTVERDGVPRRGVLRCAEGKPYADAIAAMQGAADEERWEECVRWGAAAGKLRVPSADVVAWQAYCEGQRLTAAGSRPTPQLADFVYETLRLTIMEARHDPAGSPAAQAYVQKGVAWLEQQGFGDLAADLRARLRNQFGRLRRPEEARVPA